MRTRLKGNRSIDTGWISWRRVNFPRTHFTKWNLGTVANKHLFSGRSSHFKDLLILSVVFHSVCRAETDGMFVTNGSRFSLRGKTIKGKVTTTGADVCVPFSCVANKKAIHDGRKWANRIFVTYQLLFKKMCLYSLLLKRPKMSIEQDFVTTISTRNGTERSKFCSSSFFYPCFCLSGRFKGFSKR